MGGFHFQSLHANREAEQPGGESAFILDWNVPLSWHWNLIFEHLEDDTAQVIDMYEDIYKHTCVVFEDKQHTLLKEVQGRGGELPICFLSMCWSSSNNSGPEN